MDSIKKTSIGISFDADWSDFDKVERKTNQLTKDTHKIKFSIDTNNDSFNKIDKHISELHASTKKLSEDMNSIFKKRGTNSFSRLNKDISKVQTSLTKVESKSKNVFESVGKSASESSKGIKGLNTELKETNKVNKTLIKSTDNVSKSIKSLDSDYAKLGKTGDSVNKKIGNTEGIDRAKSSLDGFSDKLAKVGGKLSIVSGAIGAGVAYGTKKSIELQNTTKQTTNLLVTGGEKQSEAIKNVAQMQADGQKYSLAYGKSQQDIAEAYQDLVKRGYTSKQALGSMRSELEASVASGDAFQDVVSVSSQVLESFGMRTDSTAGMIKNTSKVTNQLAYAADMTSTGFSDLGVGMSYVGTTAYQAGFSLSETASAMGLLSNAGLESDKAGTGLRQTINSLISPTDNATKALKGIGLSTNSFIASDGKMKSMTDIFGLLEQHTKNLSGHDKGVLFKTLFGTTGQQAGQILTSSAKELDKLNKKVAESQNQNKGKGYVANLASKNSKTTKVELEKAKEAANALAMTAGTVLLPAITDISTEGAHIADSITKWPKGVQKFATYATLGVAAIGPLALAVSGILKAVSGTTKAIKFGFSLFGKGKTNSSIAFQTEYAGAVERTNALLAEQNALANGGGGTVSGKSTKGSKASSAVDAVESLGNGDNLSRVERNTSKYSGIKGVWKSSSLLGKATIAATGIDIGTSVYKSFKDGMTSVKGKQDLWEAGGKTVGGAIGLAFGPAGSIIGAQIGGEISKHITYKNVKGSVEAASKDAKDSGIKKRILKNSQAVRDATGDGFRGLSQSRGGLYTSKSKKTDKPKKHDEPKNQDPTSKIFNSGNVQDQMLAYQTSNNLAFTNGKKNKIQPTLAKYQNNVNNASKAKSAHVIDKKSPFNQVSKSAKKEAAAVELAFQTANSRVVANAGKTSKKIGGQNAKTYEGLEKSLSSYTSNQQKSNNKELSFLTKHGGLSKKTAKQISTAASKGDRDRVKSAQKALDSIIKTEKNGGKVSKEQVTKAQKAISKVINSAGNGNTKQIKKNADREKIIYGELKDTTTKLSAKQGQQIVKNSYKTEQSTIKSAKKIYNSKKKSAEDTYNKTVQYAKDEYYAKGNISKKQYESIINKATKTKNDSITSAEDMRDKNIATAKDQHKKVVEEAKKQTKGQLKAIDPETGENKGILDKIHDKWVGWFGDLKKLGDDGAKAMASNVSGALVDANNTLNNLKNGKGGKSKVETKPKQMASPYSTTLPNGNGPFASHAKGGAISKTHVALVAEQNKELAYDPNKGTVRILGINGPTLAKVHAGERILNARDTSKVLSGGLGKGKSLPGYAKGTTKLKTPTKNSVSKLLRMSITPKVNLKNVKKAEKSTKKSARSIGKNLSSGYASATKSSVKQMSKLNASNKKLEKATATSAKHIGNSMANSFKKGVTASDKSIDKLSKDNASDWKDISKTTDRYTDTIRNSTIASFKETTVKSSKYMDQLQDNATDSIKTTRKHIDTEMDNINEGVGKSAKATAKSFDDGMSKLKSYAHKDMGGAIDSLNSGIKGIDSALSQFGGGGDVIKTIHYANGSNGPIDRDQTAIVNDATRGPRQEAIIRNSGKIELPSGKNAQVHLNKGDQVLNGTDTQIAQSKGLIPHYAKGAGSKDALRKLIDQNSSHPDKAFKSEFLDKATDKSKKNSKLQNGLNALGTNGSKSVGNKWSSAAWNALSDAKSGGSGAGGNWLNNPGLTMTDRFGSSRASMYGAGAAHDGVDFGGSLGSAIRAVHGGTVSRIGGVGISDLGKVIIVKSDDGFQEIYQEFGGMNNIDVGVGDTVKTGQKIATLGTLVGAGSGSHVHIGVTKGNPLSKNMLSTNGWYDVTKMHGSSSGTKKKSKKKSALDKLVAKQLASQIKWVGKNLVEEEFGDLGSLSLGGDVTSRAKALASAIKKLYPSATKSGIAAVLGNWSFESRLDPTAVNASGGASGLGQWLGGRKANLINYAKNHGGSWKSAATQLEFALKGDGSDSNILKHILSSDGSVASLAAAFSNQWERGGYTAQHVNGARNIASALKGFAKGGNPEPGTFSLVGEEGPEIIKPKSPTTVIPNKETNDILSSLNKPQLKPVDLPTKPSKPVINLNFNPTINVTGDTSNSKELAEQIAESMLDKLTDYLQGGIFDFGN